jgi:hypothetical protein
MHSEPIENPAEVDRQRTSLELSTLADGMAGGYSVSRRRLLLGAVAVLGGGGLTACSTGSSREAERGRQRDAERTSVVDDLQATRTASLVLGTPPATPREP